MIVDALVLSKDLEQLIKNYTKSYSELISGFVSSLSHHCHQIYKDFPYFKSFGISVRGEYDEEESEYNTPYFEGFYYEVDNSGYLSEEFHHTQDLQMEPGNVCYFPNFYYLTREKNNKEVFLQEEFYLELFNLKKLLQNAHQILLPSLLYYSPYSQFDLVIDCTSKEIKTGEC